METPAKPAQAISTARRDLMVMVLSIVGGGVDAAVYLGFHVLTAAQTGNTIVLGVSLAQGHLVVGFHSAISVAAYVAGAAVAEMLLLAKSSPSRVGPVSWTLLAELIPLVCLITLWHTKGHGPGEGMIAVLVTLAAAAMGMQSAAVMRLHAGPTTTYVTGTLTSFTTKAVSWLNLVRTASYSLASRQNLESDNLLSSRRPWIYGASWAIYAAGATGSGFLFLWVGELALLLPITAVIVALIVGTGRP
jgi:uncharacterized membrane protein YoaK (UPF0700 family)